MNRRQTLSLLTVAILVSSLACGAAFAQAGTLTVDDLKYQGAAVDVEVDVNGAAAVQLIGGLLDEAAAIAEKQASGAEGMPPQLAMAQPFIGPAKDAIKSLSRVTALVMKTDESAKDLDAAAHYGTMMADRGWSPLATVRTAKGENVLVMVAPSAKGIFAAVRPNQRQLIVALITTNEPIGDLLAQIVRAGGSDIVPSILQARAQKMEQARRQAEEEAAIAAQDCEEVKTAESPAE